MAIVITETFEIPAHWMAALAYGDITGLDDADALHLEAFLDGSLDRYPRFDVQPPQGEAYFSAFHAAREYGVLACDVYEVSVIVDVKA